ncbi:MAG: succinate--CoA ligase [ADP-forming] subunit alpha [Candidatus Micrarchaeota archaeon]|nr:MAG: succinate--CoA ligase [ADP-forming] subunit alpha [Candidatus Micrarchaeota archaeon]
MLIDRDTRVLVQGITGREGSFHTRHMLSYGTKIVAGVTPFKGGEYIENIPVYDTVYEAVSNHKIDASIIFVPNTRAVDAIYEAVDNDIKLIVVITEHIPVIDFARSKLYAKSKGARIIGPNCPGIIVPKERALLGIMPDSAFREGRIGIISRSGTLTYEVANSLREYGHSTVIGIGGDPIIGTDLLEAVHMMDNDDDTEEIVVIGEIGGDMEERLAEEYKKGLISKKIVAYIAGLTAPKEKRMGHAGAVVYLGRGTYESKIKALNEAGIKVAKTPYEIKDLL